MVGGYELRDDGEPDAATRSSAGGLCAVEALEHMWLVCGRDPWAVI